MPQGPGKFGKSRGALSSPFPSSSNNNRPLKVGRVIKPKKSQAVARASQHRRLLSKHTKQTEEQLAALASKRK